MPGLEPESVSTLELYRQGARLEGMLEKLDEKLDGHTETLTRHESEITTQRRDLDEVRSELRRQVDSVRQELRRETGAIRGEITEEKRGRSGLRAGVISAVTGGAAGAVITAVISIVINH